MKRVLNIGGNSKEIKIATMFAGWEQVLLDIDPSGSPDLCMDARELIHYNDEKFDAVYCSHNLEHFSSFDVPNITHGAYHVLKDKGFAVFIVPDINKAAKDMALKNKELEDVYYSLGDGTPIYYGDVIFGWQRQIHDSGCDFFAHKWGFTAKSLARWLTSAGFKVIQSESDDYDVVAVGVKGA